MKAKNRMLRSAVVVCALALPNVVSAQYQPVGDDGIAASPKMRQFLEEQRARSQMGAAETPVFVGQGQSGDVIARAPQFQENLTSPSLLLSGTAGDVSYKPTGDDGITASPKARQQLNERTVRSGSGRHRSSIE